MTHKVSQPDVALSMDQHPSFVSQARAAELASRLGQVRQRIVAAAQRVGQTPDSVELVAVSKRFPISDILAMRDCGVRCFGENRPQELDEKVKALLSQSVTPENERDRMPVDFHMIGHLQRNKVKLVVGVSALIHSVDSIRVAKAIDTAAQENGIVQPVLLQVNISQEENKFGFTPESISDALDVLLDHPGLEIRGLMGMASYADDAETVRPQFVRLRAMRDRLSQRTGLALNTLSMGMSNDFEIAIEEGATLVRVGSLLFGERV